MKKIQICIIMVLVSLGVNAGWLDKIADTATKEVVKAVTENDKSNDDDNQKNGNENKQTTKRNSYFWYTSKSKQLYKIASSPNESAEDRQKAFKMLGSNADFFIGMCYLNGYGVKQNFKQALKYLKEETNNLEAMLTVAAIYEKGKEEIKPDEQQAIRYYTLAANIEETKKDKGQTATNWLKKQQKEKAAIEKKEQEETTKFLAENFGYAYKNICFGESADSIISKLKMLDFNPQKIEIDYNEKFVIDLEKSITNKNNEIEIAGDTALYNFDPISINCSRASKGIEFFVCQNKGQIDDKKIKGDDLGLFVVKITFNNVDVASIAKILEKKYKQKLTSDIEKFEIKDKILEMYGMKNITIKIPTLTYKNNKIKAVLYSLPEDAKSLITFEDNPISNLDKKVLSLLKSQFQQTNKIYNDAKQKAMVQYSEAQIEAEFKRNGLVEYKNLEEYRAANRKERLNAWLGMPFKEYLKSRNFSLDSSILIVTSRKIEKMIVDETIRIVLEKQKQAAKEEAERKAETLDF